MIGGRGGQTCVPRHLSCVFTRLCGAISPVQEMGQGWCRGMGNIPGCCGLQTGGNRGGSNRSNQLHLASSVKREINPKRAEGWKVLESTGKRWNHQNFILPVSSRFGVLKSHM